MSGPVFNIGSQQAGTINNVGGDLHAGHVEGTLQAGVLLVGSLREALDQAAMRPEVRAGAGRIVEEVERELDRPQPDKAGIAERLERLARLLGGAGALAAAGDRLVAILGQLAHWLGPVGAGLAALLA
ncbi:MAG TPA: hypothetical protein VKG45_04610 [Actinomycetes bacterium]|nr:hypothetical protein [Actinomycetes bacterium]